MRSSGQWAGVWLRERLLLITVSDILPETTCGNYFASLNVTLSIVYLVVVLSIKNIILYRIRYATDQIMPYET